MSDVVDPPLVHFDVAPLVRVARMIVRALRRHWFVAALVAATFSAAGGAAAVLLPRQYSAEVRLLTRKEPLMMALADPRRAVPFGAEAPAQGATELILSRESLVAVLQRADLQARWRTHLPAVLRWKSAARERVLGPLMPEQELEALVGVLRQRVQAQVRDEVVAIRATWTDPDAVLAIVNAALEGFLEERRQLELETIARTEAILSRHQQALNGQVLDRVARLKSVRQLAQGVSDSAQERAASGPEEHLRATLLDRRRTREELERRRSAAIADLEVRLAQQSATMGERHPDRIATAEALERLTADDGGVTDARAQEEEFRRAFVAAGGRIEELESGPGFRVAPGPRESPDDDAGVIHARSLLRMDTDKLEDLSIRVQNARLELETARTAFAFRYIVTQPAERPQKPDKPIGLLVAASGLVAGLAAGVAAAALLDLRRRARRARRQRRVQRGRSAVEPIKPPALTEAA